jgi:protein-serine/threonine kinase
VFENDAEDIKLHPFFKNLEWNTLHLQPPPFFPYVDEHQPITKYFDSEQDILGSSNENGSTLTGSENQCQLTRMPSMVSLLVADLQEDSDTPLDVIRIKHDEALRWLAENNPRLVRKLENLKHRRRPRDKILRDPDMIKTAMQVRKNGAFLGYTYRKADFIFDDISKGVSSRGTILPDGGWDQAISIMA